jgi:mRNA-degrading endonuclease toxin of MazEF toxin-antitoxin module
MKKREIKCGDIYLAERHNNIGHEYSKMRPYLLVDSDDYIRVSNVVCMAPMTSNLTNRNKYDIFLARNNANRLKQDSIIKMDHMYVFDKKLLSNYLGCVNRSIIKAVHANLRKRFSL